MSNTFGLNGVSDKDDVEIALELDEETFVAICISPPHIKGIWNFRKRQNTKLVYLWFN